MKKRFLFLALTMICVVSIVTGSAIFLLYKYNVRKTEEQLLVLLKNEASLIKSIYNQTHEKERVIEVIQQSVNINKGFGETGEFTIARKCNDSIFFIIEQRYDAINSKSVSYNTDKALPMKMALSGKSGTITGKDYAGNEVFAAYEYIPDLEWGLVAKKNMKEVLQPFYKVALIALILSLLLVLVGTFIIFRITQPINKIIIESEKKYHLLFDKANDGIFITDRKGKYVDVNERGCNMLGYTLAELKNMYLHQVIESSNLEKNPVKMDLLDSGQSVIIERILRCKNGKLIDVEISGNPLLNGMYLGIVRDITERKLHQAKLKSHTEEIQAQNEEIQSQNEEIQQQNEEYKQINEEYKQINEDLARLKIKAEESDRLKSAFLSNMSHEIRTPMNGIIGFAELLNEQNLTKEKREQYTKIIIERTNQLLYIVNDILDISKIEAGLVEINNETVALNRLLEELFIFYNIKNVNSNITLKKNFGLEDEKSFILIDKNKLIQIFHNLLSNAYKFTKEGYISFGYLLNDSKLEFYIQDSGIGIARELHNKIFERFRQADDELTKLYGGTGLGLAISKELVELIGGEIWVDSELGNGSKFMFTIPYLPVENKTIESVQQCEINQSHQLDSEKTILIVDDDEVNLLYLKALLFNYKINIVEALNGLEATVKFKENKNIFLVLMDIKMPVMNGIEATKIIKSARPEVPVIAQTAYAMSSEREMTIREGCDDYISKPINKNVLFDLIQKYISKS